MVEFGSPPGFFGALKANFESDRGRSSSSEGSSSSSVPAVARMSGSRVDNAGFGGEGIEADDIELAVCVSARRNASGRNVTHLQLISMILMTSGVL